MPKIQEIPSNDLFRCIVRLKKNEVIPENRQFSCKQSIVNEITQELFKRFYKPLYIPIVAILCCFLIITSKNNINYEKNRKIVFLVTFFILILSEASLRYSTSSNSALVSRPSVLKLAPVLGL